MKLFIIVLVAALILPSTALPQSSCSSIKCPEGQKCELQQVACFAAPCFPVPTCVSNTTQCILPCPLGQSCVLETVYCKKAPCPPVPKCKAIQKDFPRTCNEVYCSRGRKCEMSRGTPVCVDPPVTDHPLIMGTMSPTVTCETLGCQPREKCVQKSYGGGFQGPQCETVTCDANEDYDRCFNGCESNCENFGPICPSKCGPGGCRCKLGYYRMSSGECFMECPRHI